MKAFHSLPPHSSFHAHLIFTLSRLSVVPRHGHSAEERLWSRQGHVDAGAAGWPGAVQGRDGRVERLRSHAVWGGSGEIRQRLQWHSPRLCEFETPYLSICSTTIWESSFDLNEHLFVVVPQLPWKSLASVVQFYYMWKTTDRYIQQVTNFACFFKNQNKSWCVHIYACIRMLFKPCFLPRKDWRQQRLTASWSRCTSPPSEYLVSLHFFFLFMNSSGTFQIYSTNWCPFSVVVFFFF